MRRSPCGLSSIIICVPTGRGIPHSADRPAISLMKAETIRRGALSLPVQERAELAERLLPSLDALSEAEIEQLWAECVNDFATP